jgi:hypothetical protein
MTAYMQQKNHSISDILLVSRQPLYEGFRTYYAEGIIRGYMGRRGRRNSVVEDEGKVEFFGRRVFLTPTEEGRVPSSLRRSKC